MIVAKTKMKRIPDTCKKCGFSNFYPEMRYEGKYCKITGYDCPMETKPSGNVGYGKPNWCPLMDIEFIEEEENE